MRLSTINSTIKIPYCFIDTDTVPYRFVLNGIHPYLQFSIPLFLSPHGANRLIF